MKFLLTKRYSWLSLCLLFCGSWLSCAVHNPVRPTIVPVKNQESSTRWILKIRLLPGAGDVVLPTLGLEGINVANNLTEITFPKNRWQPIELEYGFKSEYQCHMTLDQLLSTGLVDVISMTKSSD